MIVDGFVVDAPADQVRLIIEKIFDAIVMVDGVGVVDDCLWIATKTKFFLWCHDEWWLVFAGAGWHDWYDAALQKRWCAVYLIKVIRSFSRANYKNIESKHDQIIGQ